MHVSGREVRAGRYRVPLWSIELNFDLLRMVAPYTELQQIAGFFDACQGENAAFYFEPPALSPVTAQALGQGDGTTTTFGFVVTLGGYALTPSRVGVVSAVYLDGVVQAGSSYAVNAGTPAPSLTFAIPPASGVALTADFAWSFLCRFDDDSQDAEEFMAQLYTLQSLRLRTVRA